MGFSRQEPWSGWPFPSPRDLPDSGTEPGLLHCRQILYHRATRAALSVDINPGVYSQEAPTVRLQSSLLLCQREKPENN